MCDLFSHSCHSYSLALLLLIAVVPATAQENPASPADTVFVFVQKTSGAANFGSRQLFEHVVNDLQEYLKAKPEYVLNTSEFDDVQMRLIAMYNSRTIDNWKVAVPTLRRNPNGLIDSNSDEKSPRADQEDRPTLKRGDN